MEYSFSLVGYTTFMQLSAGLALLAWLGGFSRNAVLEKRLWILAFAAGIVGMGASFMHLHDPFHAPYTITQLGHAWMSREILFTGLFMLIVLLRLLNVLKSRLNILAAVVGVVFVVVMTQIYTRNLTVPLWHNIGTTVAFVGAMLMLGGIGGLALTACPTGKDGGSSEQADACARIGMGRVCAACFAFGAAALMTQPLYWLKPVAENALDGTLLASFSAIAPCLGSIQGLGIALAGVFAALSWRKCSYGVWLALLLALAGALSGRALFFAANIKAGITVF